MDVSPYGGNEALEMLVILMREELPALVSNNLEKTRHSMGVFRGNTEVFRRVAVLYTEAHPPFKGSHSK